MEATERANVPQRCLEQGFVRAVICRNGTQARQQQHLPSNTCVPGQAAASSGGQMLPAESGTLPHRPWTPMSFVNGRHRKRSAAGGWSEAEVCAEELPLRGGLCSECPGESPCGSIGKQLRVSKSGPGTPDC